MATFRVVPDGLEAFGAEMVQPGHVRSVRGFANLDEANAWIAEQDKAEARRDAAIAEEVARAILLLQRNRRLLRETERARRRCAQLCNSAVPSHRASFAPAVGSTKVEATS